MPTYEYICKTCGDRFDHFQSMSSPPIEKRPSCGDDACSVERVISGGTGLIFKGSGFYLTDYKNNKGSGKAEKSKKKTKVDQKTSKKKSD